MTWKKGMKGEWGSQCFMLSYQCMIFSGPLWFQRRVLEEHSSFTLISPQNTLSRGGAFCTNCKHSQSPCSAESSLGVSLMQHNLLWEPKDFLKFGRPRKYFQSFFKAVTLRKQEKCCLTMAVVQFCWIQPVPWQPQSRTSTAQCCHFSTSPCYQNG